MSVTNEPKSNEYSVWDVILHHDWNTRSEKFDADIAVVVLRDAIYFSDRASPICLPQQSDSKVVGTGSVFGWGVREISEDSDEKFSGTPSELKIPAVNDSQCFSEVPDLEYFASDRTFCGGYLNQSKATCKGDGGGGFFLQDSTTGSFNLAGIVSASITDFFGTCNVEVYSLFTNVARFVDWINVKMEESKEIVWESVDFVCKRNDS